MKQKEVKSNKKAFRIFYFVNDSVTTIFKLKSTNGKQALQTFIKYNWNGLKYNFRKVHFFKDVTTWVAELDGFATLFSEELE